MRKFNALPNRQKCAYTVYSYSIYPLLSLDFKTGGRWYRYPCRIKTQYSVCFGENGQTLEQLRLKGELYSECINPRGPGLLRHTAFTASRGP